MHYSKAAFLKVQMKIKNHTWSETLQNVGNADNSKKVGDLILFPIFF